MSAPTSMSPRPRRARLILVLASLAVVLGLAACGSSSPTSSAGAEQESEQQNGAKLADFARCMREHGVQAETTTPSGGGQAIKIGTKGPVPRERMDAAQRACQKYQPQPKKVNLSPQENVEREEAVQKFARCMREHGIELSASAGGGGVQVHIQGRPGSGGPNPESPAFRQAQNTCQKYMAKLKDPPGAGTEAPHTETGGEGGGPASVPAPEG